MTSGHRNLARVVIYDPVTQNLRATRYGLYEAGFREIDCYSDRKELQERLKGRPVDLLVADVGERNDFPDLIQQLRRGELGDNPFAVVFLTSWRSDYDTLKIALGSGADDVIIRPFSTQFMEKRVRAAVENRKQFVVTSDYLGPDRRNDPERDAGDEERMFEPPNTLRSAVNGDLAALEARSAEIETYKSIIRRERAVRLAVRVAVEAELAASGARPASGVYKLVRELYVATEPVDVEAAKLAAAMVRQTEDEGEAGRRLRLIRELAQGICALCSGEENKTSSPFVSEIETLVSRFKDGPKHAA